MVSEHWLLPLEHRVLNAVVTSPLAELLLEPGANAEVAEMSAVVQEVRLVSVSSCVKKDEQFALMPVGMV